MKRIFLLFVLFLTGCAVEKTEIKTAGFEDVTQRAGADYSNGSIWQATSTSLTEDMKARRRGDTLTIVISETASASKEAKTGTSRDSSVKAGITNMLGLETSKFAKTNFADLAALINATSNSAFKGSGNTSRQENLKATITARVMDVQANGNLMIEGRRNIKVNDEDQIIVLEGVVRSRDIAPDNTINSIYIADARISYSGRGIISDQQSPGWLMGIFTKIWPF
ncbi:MAG TPA: flagellar basal body L-ring protein FlgH [Desulfuromonadales bacterium]|nr:flagellar basal body L-ring protein FlgH [Desulfuromonadales bacterium]